LTQVGNTEMCSVDLGNKKITAFSTHAAQSLFYFHRTPFIPYFYLVLSK